MAPPAESAGPVGGAPPSAPTASAGVFPGGRGESRPPGRRLELDNDSDRVVAEQLGALIAYRLGLVDIAIFTENKEPTVVAARRQLCRVLRELGWSLPRIGRTIDRHHTSVMSLLRSDAGAHA